eukprot:scaffold9963_cov77-Phaeocystis_antarctica.AAC.2
MPGLAWSSPCTTRPCRRSCRSAAAGRPPPTRALDQRSGSVARAVHPPRRAARAVGAGAASMHIVPGGGARLPHPHCAPHAALADLLKVAALAQQRRRRRDEVERQAVEYHGQAAAAKRARGATRKRRATAGRAH